MLESSFRTSRRIFNPLSRLPTAGNLQAGSAIPFTEVAPVVWMKKLGTLPRDKAERKRAIRELMERQFPGLEVTLKTADALGFLVFHTT